VAERTYKSIVFEVLPDAIEQERSPSGLIDSRGLFYAVRRLYNAHPERPFEKERKKAEKGQGEPLDYAYFNGEMLHHYEDRYGEIEGLTREPRGHLFEAHTIDSGQAHTIDSGQAQEIGTVFAGHYEPPNYYYDKVLFCEKHGFAQVLVDEGLGERYDMAIIASKGYRTQADIRLLRTLSEEGYPVLVLHDCDHDGFGIFAALRGGSELMPDLFVPAIDLGMSLEDTLSFDPPLLGEDATRQKAIPERTIPYLSAEELEMFTGTRRGKVWDIWRVELNEIPANQRVAFVEKKLIELGYTDKVLPPEGYLQTTVDGEIDEDIGLRVGLALSDLIDEYQLTEEVSRLVRDRYGFEDMGAVEGDIKDDFRHQPSLSWRQALSGQVEAKGDTLQADINAAVRETLWQYIDTSEPDNLDS
jgi:hypothetical protein